MPRSTTRLTKSRKGVGGRKRIVSSLSETRPRPPSSPVLPKKPSSSSRKLDFSGYDSYKSNENYNSEIIDISLLSEKLLSSSLCKNCKANGLQIQTVAHIGLAATLELFCAHCSFSEKFCSSKKVVCDNGKPFYDVNIRLVYGLRSIGKGQASGQMLCAMLNLPQPPTRFLAYSTLLRDKAEAVANESMKAAVLE